MKIICLVKFVPKVDDFQYDYERNVLIRSNVPMILNPDDACALGFALELKEKNPDVSVEILSMGPLSLKEKMADLLRRNVDKGTLISDKKYMGSDSFATSLVLSAFLKGKDYDLILSGSQTLDGDTGHIGPQISQLLDLPQCSNVVKVDEVTEETVAFTMDDDDKFISFEMALPCVLSISKESKYKLKFVRAADIDKNVDDKLSLLSNDQLQVAPHLLGIKGSPTKVTKTITPKIEKTKREYVTVNEEGIDKVFQFLKDKGVISHE